MLTNLLLDEIDPRSTWCAGSHAGASPPSRLWTGPSTPCSSSATTKAGDYPGIGAHTISYGEYADVRLDGRTVGEGEIFAIRGGPGGRTHGLIAGDDVVCAEMAKAVPGIETAVVKEAMSRTGGRIIPPVRAQRIIRGAAQRATELVASGDLALPEASPPFAMEVELRSPLSADALRQIAQHDELAVVGDRTVAFVRRMASAYVWAASVQILAAGKPLRDG